MKHYMGKIYIVMTTSMLAGFCLVNWTAEVLAMASVQSQKFEVKQELNTMEANKKVVEQYVERFNSGDLQGMKAIFADDALIQGVLGWGKIADVMPIWKELVNGLAMQLEIEDMIAEGDVVAVRYKESGTAKAPFFGKPATGKSYELVAMEWFIVKDGKIQRRWGARDAASQARQLGWDVPAVKADVKTPAKP